MFHDHSDYLVYIRVLKNGCNKYRVLIWAYTLMTNHVHLVGVPEDDKGLSKALHDAHTAYSKYFNAKYGFVGHACQSRPDISVMDEAYMWKAIRYSDRNPVCPGMVVRAEDYLWSSAAAHCGLRDDILLSPGFPPAGVIPNWSEWLTIDHTEKEKAAIRHHLKTGWPWCKPEMLFQLEAMTGQKLHSNGPGRPRKKIQV